MFEYLSDNEFYKDFYRNACNIADNWSCGDYKICSLWCRQAIVAGIKRYMQLNKLTFMDVGDLLYFANKSTLQSHIDSKVKSAVLYIAIIGEMIDRNDETLTYADYEGCLRNFDVFARWLAGINEPEAVTAEYK